MRIHNSSPPKYVLPGDIHHHHEALSLRHIYDQQIIPNSKPPPHFHQSPLILPAKRRRAQPHLNADQPRQLDGPSPIMAQVKPDEGSFQA